MIHIRAYNISILLHMITNIFALSIYICLKLHVSSKYSTVQYPITRTRSSSISSREFEYDISGLQLG